MDVSIVVPVHNVEPYIERCLRSVMAQTFAGSLECIIVDDCSPDGSIAVAQRVLADYAGPVEFRMIRFPENRGLPIARNEGMDAAQGEYLMFMDSDDELTPDCIEKLMAPMRRDPGLEMVMGDFRYVPDGCTVDPKMEVLSEEDITSREKIVALSHSGNYVTCWNKLIRRSFLVEHGIRLKKGILAEDSLWTFYLTRHLGHMYTIPDVTYLYRIRPNSMITGIRKEEWYRHWGSSLAEIAGYLAADDPYHESEAFVDHICTQLRLYPRIQVYDEALRIFKETLRQRGQRGRIAYVGLVHGLSRTKIGRWLLPGVWKVIWWVRRGRWKMQA